MEGTSNESGRPFRREVSAMIVNNSVSCCVAVYIHRTIFYSLLNVVVVEFDFRALNL